MPRVICEFCHARVPSNRLALHQKHCIKARRALKKQIGFVKIEDPSDLEPTQELIETVEPTADDAAAQIQSEEELTEEVIAPEPTADDAAGKSKKKKR